MEKSTDSSTTSPTTSSNISPRGSTTAAGRSSNASTATSSSESNQQEQNLQKHHLHYHPNNSTAAATTPISTPNKNQLNNSLGCGPSSSTTTTAAAKPSLLDRKGSSSNMVIDGSSNSNTNNISSLNNTTLNHQSSNNTTSTTRNTAAATLPNTASASVSSTTTSSPSQMAPINLNISTTTGGNFSVSVDPQITVENLKKIIAKKLKVAKDRICLLHREKELQDGLLKDNNLMDGSKIILIPNVETGLLAQRPENTVMQALESLNDSQVNDFLSGKTPLNLSMRLGDHMMLIQLQLSTVNPVNGVSHSGANCSSSSSRQRSSHHHHHHHRSSRMSATATSSSGTQTAGATTTANHSHHHHHHHHHHHGSNTAVAGSATTGTTLTPTAVSVATTAQNVAAVRKLELDTTCQTPRNSNSATLIAPHASRTVPNINGSTSSSLSASTVAKNSDLSSFLSKRDYESLQNIVKSIAMAQPSRLVQQSITTSNTKNPGVESSSIVLPSASNTSVPVVATPSFHTASEAVLLEQSPIKSLSNLVSSPIKTTAIKNIPKMSNNTSSSSTNNSVALGPHTALISAVPAPSSNTSIAAANSAMCQDPIAAKLTSCLCTRLNGGSLGTVNNTPHNSAKQCVETACVSQQQLQTTPLHHHHNHHRQLQLQPNVTRTSTSTIMASTPNYKATLIPSSITTSLNGTTNSSATSRSSSYLHKTAHNPISRKHRHHHHHHHHHHHYHHAAGVQQQLSTSNNQKVVNSNSSAAVKVVANDSGFNSGDDSLLNTSSTKSSSSPSPTNSVSQLPISDLNSTSVVAAAAATAAAPSTTSNSLATVSSASLTTPATNAVTPIELDDSGIVSDSRTLAEASRNLTQTLRKLSKEVFTNKIDFTASEEAPRKSGSGAVIESMKNHGKGIYSGTFSGTLNPALQDRYGRPKRDISTVIHILNDLLSATPQYHRGARISFEAPSTSAAAAASVAAASGSTGTVHHSSRSKHISSKHHQSSHPCVKCIKTHNSSTSTVNLQSVSTLNTSGATHNHSSGPSSAIYAYGECNGHYVSSKSQSTKIYPCCPQDSTITTAASSSLPSPATASSGLAQHYQVGHNSSSSNTTSNTSNGHHHHHHHHHGSSHHHHHHHHHQVVDERKVCQCRYRVHSETGERERDYTCQKCAAELDNIKTKSKLDQLRLVMQQRKQKREARKLKGAPYGARVVGTTTTATASGIADNTTSTLTASNSTISTPISVATSATTPSDVSPNHLVEEVDTAA